MLPRSDSNSFQFSLPESNTEPSILALPDELFAAIFDLLWEHGSCGRLQSLLPASLVCKAFRRAALPCLFESVSCSVREQVQERPPLSFRNIVDRPHLLSHVRTLHVRVPLRDVGICGSDHPKDAADRLSLTTNDLEIIKRGMKGMRRLRTIR